LGKIAHPAPDRDAVPTNSRSRVLAALPSVRIIDTMCRLGPEAKGTENAFPDFRVAAVVAGSFAIRTGIGGGVASAGSLVIGNACDCYRCRHFTQDGDRCIYFDFRPEFLEEVRLALGLRGVGERFRRGLLPPALQSVAITTLVDSATTGHDSDALEEAAFEMAAAALAATHATMQLGRRTSLGDERRIVRALGYIESNFHRSCTLSDLAAEAGLSAYHFLRVFRRVTGQTPHRHVLATRLRHAARRLRATADRVIDIVADMGFGDVSNFNAQFMRAFGVSPSEFRTRHAARVLRRSHT